MFAFTHILLLTPIFVRYTSWNGTPRGITMIFILILILLFFQILLRKFKLVILFLLLSLITLAFHKLSVYVFVLFVVSSLLYSVNSNLIYRIGVNIKEFPLLLFFLPVVILFFVISINFPLDLSFFETVSSLFSSFYEIGLTYGQLYGAGIVILPLGYYQLLSAKAKINFS